MESSTSLRSRSAVLALHSIFGLAIIGSLLYDISYTVDPYSLTTDAKKAYAGKFKYLTHWNLWLQSFYWAVAILVGIFTLNYEERNRPAHRFVDYLHASVAFPLGTAMCVIFWAIYSIDRELVYPKLMDQFVPHWLNHVRHTVHIPLLLIDKYLVPHIYPKQSHGISLLLLVPLLYQIWILYLGIGKGLWVYPVLNILTWPSRLTFFLAIWIFFIIIYKLGSALSRHMGGEAVDAESLKHE